MWEIALPTAFGILAACTAVNLFAAVFLARRTLPQRLENRLQITEAMVGEQQAALYKFRSENEVAIAEASGFRDQARDFFARSEKKAARVRAAESREAHNPATPRTRDEVVNEGRRIRLATGQ